MRHAATLPALALFAGLAACSSGSGSEGEASGAGTADGATLTDTGAPAAVSAAPADSASAAAPVPAAMARRTGELSNPDDFAMLMLYYSLSGLTPPVDKWVEDDMSVRTAVPADKAAARDAARARIAAGLASVRNVGRLRITTNADLSDYDPTYGEYTVRVFAPSSSLLFNRSGEPVSVKFDNAQAAQRWAVPKAEAQSVKDRIQYNSSVIAEALLQIAGASPENNGGTIRTRIVEYELKNNSSGTTIARVRVPG